MKNESEPSTLQALSPTKGKPHQQNRMGLGSPIRISSARLQVHSPVPASISCCPSTTTSPLSVNSSTLSSPKKSSLLSSPLPFHPPVASRERENVSPTPSDSLSRGSNHTMTVSTRIKSALALEESFSVCSESGEWWQSYSDGLGLSSPNVDEAPSSHRTKVTGIIENFESMCDRTSIISSADKTKNPSTKVAPSPATTDTQDRERRKAGASTKPCPAPSTPVPNARGGRNLIIEEKRGSDLVVRSPRRKQNESQSRGRHKDDASGQRTVSRGVSKEDDLKRDIVLALKTRSLSPSAQRINLSTHSSPGCSKRTQRRPATRPNPNSMNANAIRSPVKGRKKEQTARSEELASIICSPRPMSLCSPRPTAVHDKMRKKEQTARSEVLTSITYSPRAISVCSPRPAAKAASSPRRASSRSRQPPRDSFSICDMPLQAHNRVRRSRALMSGSASVAGPSPQKGHRLSVAGPDGDQGRLDALWKEMGLSMEQLNRLRAHGFQVVEAAS